MSVVEEAFDLLPLLREGNPSAQASFCRSFEPFIRREVRLRLRMDERLCRVLDSVDVCQEVLNSFLIRTNAGEYDLSEVPQLLALLKKMLKNKLSKKRRWHYAERRSLKRQSTIRDENWSVISGNEPSVFRMLSNQELLEQILLRLEEDERNIAQKRAEGESWQQIAEPFGVNPDAIRMKLARALERVIKSGDFLE